MPKHSSDLIPDCTIPSITHYIYCILIHSCLKVLNTFFFCLVNFFLSPLFCDDCFFSVLSSSPGFLRVHLNFTMYTFQGFVTYLHVLVSHVELQYLRCLHIFLVLTLLIFIKSFGHLQPVFRVPLFGVCDRNAKQNMKTAARME